MNKQTITGIAAAAILFIGFAYFSGREQKKYQEEMAAWQAYQDSVAAVQHPELPAAETASDGAEAAADEPLATDRQALLAATLGETLASSHVSVAERAAVTAPANDVSADTVEDAAEPQPAAPREEEFTVENEVLAVRFSTLGGQIKGVTLKEYTRYAPKGERTEAIEMFDSESARFDMSFYVKSGNRTLPIHTMEYFFTPSPVERLTDGSQRIEMRLPVAEGAALVYEYTIHAAGTPERDYLVDFRVRMDGMESAMANQSTLGIEWANTSFQNEKGFQNENMYTTLSYRFPDESAVKSLGMGEGRKTKEVASSINWIAFKQQFFSSVFIAPDNFANAALAFDTAQPGSGYLKSFDARMTVPYDTQHEVYDFAFYFGPNLYPVLKKVALAPAGDREAPDLYIERLIPLGWGIMGWINRWCVIPVFNFLHKFIDSFGLIILILAVLIRLVISPMTYKSYVSMAKMRLLKPQVDEITKKYPKQEDAMKRQQATMDLYRKAGANPMGGCIPMLIQMPILIAMFRFFPASIELRDQPFLWADDLSSFDSVLNLPFSIPFYGDHVSLFALLMALSTFTFSYISYQQSASAQPQMAGMKFMMVYLMPIMLLFWFNSYSSGLCWYYLLSNLLTIGQTFLIRRMVDDSKIQAIMAAAAAKKSKGKKSRFQQRYEELMRQQQQMQQSQSRSKRR